jgi:hypothetical protein
MTETRTEYKVGELTLVQDEDRTSEDIVIDHYFTRTATGLLVNETPPEEAFLALGLRMVQEDQSRQWQWGDWGAELRRIYGKTNRDILAKLAAMCGVKERAVEDWAMVAYNVPQEIRFPPDVLSFRHHRVIVKLRRAPQKQKEWLEKAVKNKWGYRKLEEEVNKAEGFTPDPDPLPSDRLEATQHELYNLEIQYQEAQHRVAELETENERLKASQPVLLEAQLEEIRELLEKVLELDEALVFDVATARTTIAQVKASVRSALATIGELFT